MKDKEIIFRTPAELAAFLLVVEEAGATYRIFNEYDDGKAYWIVVMTGGF